MDPQEVLAWLERARAFVETYGNLVFAYVEQLVALLVRLLADVPGWLAAVWHFLKGIVALVRSVGGF